MGIELILQNQRQLLKRDKNLKLSLGQLKQELLKANSLLTFSVLDQEKVRLSKTHRHCAEMISLLSPMDIRDSAYIRVGRDFDGGYVMLDNFHRKNVDAAYSFGICDDVSWDEAIADRGIDVFMFDHTIESLPRSHPNFHYFKLGVTGNRKGDNLKTLKELLEINGNLNCNNLIMKMDIEGCEWDVFEESQAELIGQFSQIVIELHGLFPTASDADYQAKIAVLQKINSTHQSIHVHANAGNSALWIGDMVLPSTLEVTYIRRTDVRERLAANTRRFPTNLDQPTFDGIPDLELGEFSTQD